MGGLGLGAVKPPRNLGPRQRQQRHKEEVGGVDPRNSAGEGSLKFCCGGVCPRGGGEKTSLFPIEPEFPDTRAVWLDLHLLRPADDARPLSRPSPTQPWPLEAFSRTMHELRLLAPHVVKFVDARREVGRRDTKGPRGFELSRCAGGVFDRKDGGA